MLINFLDEKKKLEKPVPYKGFAVRRYSPQENPSILKFDPATIRRFSPEVYQGILNRVKHLEDL